MECEIEELDEGWSQCTVFLDRDDQCMWCENQYGCPLIECLSNGLVEATEPIRVVDCAHYKTSTK